ncbi:MAG: magnesium transporter CorA [Oscillospiraceae bacterium]|nr:magnesium transporter CorA [Oscillospiraceae bacterium]
MQYYLIQETVTPCAPEEIPETGDTRIIAVMTPEEWKSERERIGMGIEFDPTTRDIRSTKAEANYGSLTGTFKILNRENLLGPEHKFAFAMDERRVVFIDRHSTARKIIESIAETKRWRSPSIEHFLYDFLEQIISRDFPMIEKFETELDSLEDRILSGDTDDTLTRVNQIRSIVRRILSHYEQLIDMVQELEENENGFFSEENLRYIHLFMNRMDRYHDSAVALKEHSMQVRDLYREQLEVRQNRTVTLLTVVTTIFMPLTLIVGWYGMNFTHMPELDSPLGYPLVIVASIVIIAGMLVFFKKKKWL